MKDALGHGSNSKGAHASGVDSLPRGWGPVKMVAPSDLRPRPENTAMIEKFKRQDAAAEASFKEAYPGEKYTPQEGDMRYKVDAIRQRIRNGESLPPLAVNKDNSIEDGENRWRAYVAEGVKQIPVRFRK